MIVAETSCRARWIVASALVLVSLAAGTAHAQLRVVSYNTTGGPETGMDIVLRSIGEELRNGIAKPIDVLLLQETSRAAGLPDTQAFVNLLNSMYSGQTHLGMPITYARGNLTGNVSFSEDSSQSLVYRVETVDLIAETAVGFASGSTQPRQALRYQLRPDGYDSTADFYAYNSHFKAGTNSQDPNNTNRRNLEAQALMTNANLLGNAHAIYAGDMNLYTAGEPAFQTMLGNPQIGNGNGKAIDPLGLTNPSGNGNWSSNSSVSYAHTQSPCSSAVGGCSVGGGMDDRFDFQLITEEFNDDEGLDIIEGSYHAFGNGGGFCCNSSITSAFNPVTFLGVTSHTKSQILEALRTVTDHIPVVVDYQVPAIMSAIASTIPETFNVGDVFNLDLTVSNAANVVAANGADELDYSITSQFNGAALNFSSFDQIDAALGGGNLYQILLDTSTPGVKTDVLSIASGSQGVMNALIEIPISYEVLAIATGLAGDFNDDGIVDGADYSVWRNHLGEEDEANLNNNGDGGDVSATDYDLWKSQYGMVAEGSGGLAGRGNNAVPEPASWLLLVVGCCLCGRRFGTLGSWPRVM